MKKGRLSGSIRLAIVVAFGLLPAASQAALRLELLVQPAYILGDPILVGLRLVNDADRILHAERPHIGANLHYVVEMNEGEALPCVGGCSIPMMRITPTEFGPKTGVTRVIALGFFYEFNAGAYNLKASYEGSLRRDGQEAKRADPLRLETSVVLLIEEPTSVARKELLAESLTSFGVLRGIGWRDWPRTAESWPASPLRQYITLQRAKSHDDFEMRDNALRDLVESAPSFRFRQMAELALCESRLVRGNADEECGDEILSRLSDPLVKDRAAALLAEHREPPTEAPR